MIEGCVCGDGKFGELKNEFLEGREQVLIAVEERDRRGPGQAGHAPQSIESLSTLHALGCEGICLCVGSTSCPRSRIMSLRSQWDFRGLPLGCQM